jgi:DNA polymerase-3 subunit alpha
MEECKSMGLKVLGPDINESQSGFAVNKKGEIRFGFSGLKGVGEAAIDNIIEERGKSGHFKDIFDLVKRSNLKSVNKKSVESLIHSGAFDCFKDMHRAQFFYQAPGDTNALEKILKFGSVYQSQSSRATNTLFGDMQMPEIVPPKIPPCTPFQLIEQLDFERDVTGMYISGHPLDNFKFELAYYNINPLTEFNNVKNAIAETPNTRQFRLAGLVIDAQHRLTKNGKNFGVLHLEDFSSKTEFMLWSEDYQKYSHYLEAGRIVLIEGSFKQRFNNGQYEFKISKFHLLETLKTTITKQIILELSPQLVDENLINFIEENTKKHPGKTTLKFNIIDELRQKKLGMSGFEKGITMNDEIIEFLAVNKHIDVYVSTI